MPELPEVERTVRYLRPVMEGARIARVTVRRRRLRTLLPANFASRLEGAIVENLSRRGKYLVAGLSSGETLIMHLGMSGSLEIRSDPRIAHDKHDHVLFHLSSGADVVFNDPRRFGFMRVLPAEGGPLDPFAGKLGPEPMASAFEADTLAGAFLRRRTSLKSVLSDQRIVAGLGNIYVCEALFRAGLSPLRAATTLVTPAGAPRPTLRRLVHAIRATLRKALSLPEESDGRFRVYDREGLPCLRRGCRGTIRRIVQAGRSTFYCPTCQR